jgi:hypothetical protein
MTDFRVGIKVINGEYCLAATSVAQLLGSIDTVKSGLIRNRAGNVESWKHYPDPTDKRKKWIVYKSLPGFSKQRVDEQIGMIEQAYCKQLFIENLESFIHPNDYACFLSEEAPVLLSKVRACAFLRMLAEGVSRDKFKTEFEYYSKAGEVVFEDDSIALSIKNPRALKRKVQAFREMGPECLVHGMHGYANNAKICDEGWKWIVHCYASPLKPTFRKVAHLYNQEAKTRTGWAPVTEERVRQILQSEEVNQMITVGRHGVMAARTLHERTIKRRRATRPDQLWTLDGFTIQLRYKNENNEIKSDLYAIVVMDVYSLRMLGWNIGSRETTTLVQGALRAACRTTMMRPDQLQFDNSSANKAGESTHLFRQLTHMAFPTAPYNGKSKPIEAAWGHVEKLVLHSFPNFKGGNITSHSLDIKANPDLLKNIEYPTMEEAINQYRLAIHVWNERVGETGRTPNERYKDSMDDRTPLEWLQWIQALWVPRTNTVRYTKDGVTIQVNHERYTYEVESELGIEDLEWRRKWLGTEFNVMYDPQDMKKIALFHDNVFVAFANTKYEYPLTVSDMREGEGVMIRKALNERKRMISDSKEKLNRIREDVEAIGLPGELDFDILHKDELNRVEQQLIDQELDWNAVDTRRLPKREVKKRDMPVINSMFNIDEDEEIQDVGYADDYR